MDSVTGEIEVFDFFGTPTRRDPKAPPFIIEQAPWQQCQTDGGDYRVMGTFPTGVVSVIAVPLTMTKDSIRPGPWIGWLSKSAAIDWAERLNRMEAEGRINWDGMAPVIIPDAVQRQATRKTA